MSKEINAQNRVNEIKELFLKIFQEKDVTVDELKEAICQSYMDEGFDCKTFDDIPIKEMENAILDCYEAGGLSFENIDQVIEHNSEKED